MTDDHVCADREDAAERYLLGQMNEADRDQYERHFFSCGRCADEVKETARFMDTCERVLAVSPTVTPVVPLTAGRRPRAWFPRTSSAIITGALAATLALTVYQNVVTIPGLRRSATPQTLTGFSFVAFNSRGGADRTIAAPRERPFQIYFDIPPGSHAPRFECHILAEDGRVAATTEVSEIEAQETVSFMIPAGQLVAGSYTLVVTAWPDASGQSPGELARFPFTLRFAD